VRATVSRPVYLESNMFGCGWMGVFLLCCVGGCLWLFWATVLRFRFRLVFCVRKRVLLVIWIGKKESLREISPI
jgi:hypothetical protein